MKPLSRLAFTCLLIWSLAMGGAGWAHSAALLDDAGNAVPSGPVPARIVSLLPSLTETVCVLDACSRLVGVDTFSNFPEPVRKIAKVGDGLNPNIEALLRVRPDVVLISRSSPARTRLQELGLRLIVLEPQNHADLRRAMLVIGQLLQSPQAQSLLDTMDRDIEREAAALPASVRDLRVYMEINRAPYAAGEASFMGDILKRLGARNIVGPELGAFPKLNPEFVVRANPDVIMVGDSDPQAMDGRPGWGRIRAIQERKICSYTQAQSDMLVRPGPRMAQGAAVMAACLKRFAR